MGRKYAEKICAKYGVEYNPAMLTGKEATTYEVAWSVLPTSQLCQWLIDSEAEFRVLREKLDMKPYDLHTQTIDEELAKL